MAAIRPRDLGTILSIWAHPDDKTYLARGRDGDRGGERPTGGQGWALVGRLRRR